MNRFIRWYNQNRKTIWKCIGVAALIIIVIQLFNYWSKLDSQEKLEETNQIQISNEINQYNSIDLDETKSTITGDELSQNQLSEINVIDMFIEYCNNQQISEAYALLSEDCKQEMY